MCLLFLIRLQNTSSNGHVHQTHEHLQLSFADDVRVDPSVTEYHVQHLVQLLYTDELRLDSLLEALPLQEVVGRYQSRRLSTPFVDWMQNTLKGKYILMFQVIRKLSD